jgi:nucleoside-diphosphate-sugar epimerase
MKRAIVTGATGYIGSRLCRYLVSKNVKVYALIRSTSDLYYLKDIRSSIETFEYDQDIGKLIEFFKGSQASVVFHLAAAQIKKPEGNDIDTLINSNILYGIHILEAMKESSVKIMINTSSYWQYNDSGEYNPVNLYAATKEAFTRLAKYYSMAENLRIMNLILFDVYGEGDRRVKIFNLLDRIASQNVSLDMSPGEQYLDFIHVDDVVQAFVSAYEYIIRDSGITYADFGVGSQNPVTLKELVRLFEKIYDKKLNIAWGAFDYEKRQIMNPLQKYKTLPDWSCSIDLTNGIRRIKNYGNTEKSQGKHDE